MLIGGRSGSGKSDLALRLIDRGAVLVSDDYTMLERVGRARCARRAPATIAGKIEMRGVGIVELGAAPDVPVALFVDLDAAPERLPEPASRLHRGRARSRCSPRRASRRRRRSRWKRRCACFGLPPP